jgi:hypothetical protein
VTALVLAELTLGVELSSEVEPLLVEPLLVEPLLVEPLLVLAEPLLDALVGALEAASVCRFFVTEPVLVDPVVVEVPEAELVVFAGVLTVTAVV